MSTKEVQKLLDEKRYIEALIKAEKLVYNEPSSSLKLELLLKCCLLFGKLDKATEICRKLIAINPRQDPENQYAEIIARMKQDVATIQREFKERKFSECSSSILLAAKNSPKSFFLRMTNIKCLTLMDKLEEADEVVKSLLIDFPTLPEVIYRQGVIFFHQGKLAESLRFIKESIELDNNEDRENMKQKVKSLLVCVEEAEKLIGLGKFIEAIEIYTKVLSEFDLYIQVFLLFLTKRAKAFALASQYNNAIYDLSQALSVDPTRSDVLLFRAEYYFALKDKEKCVADCQASIAIEPSQKASDLLAKVADENVEGLGDLSSVSLIVNKLIEEGKMNEVAQHFLNVFNQHSTQEHFLLALKSLVDIDDFRMIEDLLKSVEKKKDLKHLVPDSLRTLIREAKKNNNENLK